MLSMSQKIGKKFRWELLDEALLDLHINKVLTDSEVKKAKHRLRKKCMSDGVPLKQNPLSLLCQSNG